MPTRSPAAQPGPTDIPTLIRDLRRALGLTQEQLAQELDVTFASVNGWERGRHKPIRALVARILELARAAGVAAKTTADPIRRQPSSHKPRGRNKPTGER